jgi:predicted exporter
MVTGVVGYYALVSTLSSGVSIPIYASPDTQGQPLFYIDITPADVLSLAAGGSINEKIGALLKNIPLELHGAVMAQLSGLARQTEQFSAMLSAAADGFFAEIDGQEYTYFAVTIGGMPESEQALDTINAISESIDNILGAPERLAAGNSQAVFDLKGSTEKDFIMVSALSALLILVILIVTFRRLLLPLLLVALIELAILLNISLTAVRGGELNFMSYIVISAIQMGATIDYAILLTQNYLSARKELGQLEAAESAVKTSAFSMLISASILVCACMSVNLVSSDRIIGEITMLIARGAAISAALVLTALPAILSIRLKRRKNT